MNRMQLTPSGCPFIVRAIPQGHMVGGISLIWAIPNYIFFESFVQDYIDHYYANDSDVQCDAALQVWFEMLDRYFINGIRGYVPSLTKENLIKLCTLYIYSVTCFLGLHPALPTHHRLQHAIGVCRHHPKHPRPRCQGRRDFVPRGRSKTVPLQPFGSSLL